MHAYMYVEGGLGEGGDRQTKNQTERERKERDVKGVGFVPQDELTDLGECVHQHKNAHEIVADEHLAAQQRHVVQHQRLQDQRVGACTSRMHI